MDINFEFGRSGAHILTAIGELAAQLHTLNSKVTAMATNLDALTAQVAQNTDVINSALTLINGFAAELAAAGTDPVALQALADSLKASDTSLAAAVAANTPASTPAPATDPTPAPATDPTPAPTA